MEPCLLWARRDGTFQNLTMCNGFTDCSFSGGSGGVRNVGTLTVINSIFSNNLVCFGGGGIRNEGTMTVTNSTFSNNGSAGGGGIENLGTLTVTNSTFSDNGGGGRGGGGSGKTGR